MGNLQKNRRLIAWDYSNPGAYFITFCTRDKQPYLGKVTASNSPIEPVSVALSPIGKACNDVIDQITSDTQSVELLNRVVMPNHVHLLLKLSSNDSIDVSYVVRKVKAQTTKMARKSGFTDTLWQRSFYDHIVRDEADLQRIHEYIDANPGKWAEDRFYCANWATPTLEIT